MNAVNFDKSIDGNPVQLFHIHSKNISCFVTNYGARVVSLSTLSKESRMVDVVLGFDSIDGYINAEEQYHGATVGRYANRIANGSFQLGDHHFQLPINNGPNTLHGGISAFHNKIWRCIQQSDNQVILELISPHLEEGFPGELKTQVTYTIEGSSLRIHYEAISTEDTVINLTHHSYFNLNGEGEGTVLNHSVRLNSEYYTPVDVNIIPTGAVDMVADTPFDFTSFKRIGEDIDQAHEQLKLGVGYDHNFVVNHYTAGELNFVGEAIGDQSNIKMEVWSTEPGVQFYSANHLSGVDVGKSGRPYASRTAFCLETQHFPDSPNQKHFPSTLLEADQSFSSSTEYRFSIAI